VLVPLPYIPAGAVAGHGPPAHEGRLPGKSQVDVVVIGHVERVDLDAVRGDGGQLPLRGVAGVARAAEHLGHQPLPLLPGGWRELSRQ